MPSGLEAALLERWYGEHPPGLALRAIAAVYAVAMRLRRWAYRVGLRRQHNLPVPVVVVGNRSVGGTGKTPTVIALVLALRARGWRPGVISRGYGRRGTGPRRVGVDSLAAAVGDEPLLIHGSTGVPVEVDRDRVAAAWRLVDAGCDVLIADDGLQHLRLGRRVEVEVQDARALGNRRVLPAGPLREPLPRRAADLRLAHGRSTAAGEVAMRFLLGDARRIGSGSGAAAAIEARPLGSFAGLRVHAVAGIGHPPRFFAALSAAGLAVVEHPFPDHHRFTAADFAGFHDAPILMTGKDAVKCRGFALADAWEVPVTAVLPEAILDALDHRLRSFSNDVEP